MQTTAPLPATAVADPTVLTLGVEEEFLLLDPHTGHNLPVAEQVLAELPEPVRRFGHLEFRRSMVEMVSPVCTGLAELRAHLRSLRRAAAAAATASGARLVAVGATPIADTEPTSPDVPRYRAIVRQYEPIARDPACCGCHVHVGVPDRETAVQVCNHLRPWLPVIQALTVNSPLFAGADTGHASWRSMQLERWPSLGPSPYFESADDYDRTVAALIGTGVMLDESMVYWYARPSVTYPTVEVRVGDVCASVDDAVVVAGLIRALVATAVDDVRAGLPAVRPRDCVLAAAHWQAAHDGLGSTLIDLRHGGDRPAWELVGDLLAAVTPALLRHGDLEPVRRGLSRLRARGTGAARQRAVHRRTGDVHAVLADLARRTAGT